MLEALERGACHLWHWRPPAHPGDGYIAAAKELLDEMDEGRYRRYLVPEAAATLLASRVLLRSVLSAYWGLKPAAWRFTLNEWGCPRVANPGVPRKLHFNLSHKPGFVTCLVGYGRELGVDVENVSVSRPQLLQMASRFFSPAEAASLNETAPEVQLSRFYEFWTLKESYIKARGRGLSLGLSGFSFSVEGTSARVRFEQGFDDRAERWDFRLFPADPSYLMATTLEIDQERPLAVEVRPASPLIARVLNLDRPSERVGTVPPRTI